MYSFTKDVKVMSSYDQASPYNASFTRGNKDYELSNHLGNVLTTISDKKLGHTATNGTVDYYDAEILTSHDYYPFGATQPGRSSGAYRYGFNGKEKDKDGDGQSIQYDYGFRIYDPHLGRFKSVDPLTHETPFESPYSAMGNNPILNIDPDGQSWEPIGKDGKAVKLSDKESINGYRWVGYDKDDKGNMVARANTVETAYTFGAKGMTTLSSEGYKANKNWQAYEDISTGDKNTDKKFGTLHPNVQNQMKSFILEAKNRFDIDLRVTDGFRSVAEQDKLYAKGRTAPGSIVTKAPGGFSIIILD